MYNIIIDGSADPSFGSDQAYISYPTVFPTVFISGIHHFRLIRAFNVSSQYWSGDANFM